MCSFCGHKMKKIIVKILILISSFSVLNGYSIFSGHIENMNTFIETTVPLKTKYLGSKQDKIITYSTNKNHVDVHVSHDNGLTFTNKLDQFLIEINGTHILPQLQEIYVSINGKIVVFTDIFHRILFISTNFGQDFKLFYVSFKPSLIEFYGDENHLIVFDDNRKTLYYSNNYGSNFFLIEKNVDTFQWQIINEFNQNLLFGLNSSICIFNGSDQTKMKWEKVSGIRYLQFQVVEDFVFILASHENKNFIYVVYKNGPLMTAELYPQYAYEGFHVAGIEENSIKLAVVHKSESRLYVGNYRKNSDLTIQFVLSLKNIVSHVPKITWNSTLIRIKKPLTELYNIDGLSGIYIANVHHLRLYSKLDYFSISDIKTVITLDNGVTWNPFDARFYDPANNFIDCTTQCRIKLNTELFDSIGFNHLQTIKSNKNVLGLILASGIVQSTSQPPSTHPYIFLSNDMGKSWQKILNGFYSLNIGNHGGIIIAVKSQGTTKELLYSFNYGGNWNEYVFHDHGITVFDLFTSDTHNSTEFHLVGYDGVRRRQTFIKLEFKNIFKPNCAPQFPHSGINWRFQHKVFGKNIVLEQMVSRKCLNFKPIEKVQIASCNHTDYECDDGYFRTSLTSYVCHPRNKVCKPGSFYITGNLRKIENNNCQEFGPMQWSQNITCPITDEEKFMLIANGTSVHRLNISNITQYSILVQANTTVRAISFDIETKCLFYSEFGTGQIKQKCPDSTEKILIPETDTWYRSLAYDVASKVLYYLDARTNKVFAVRADKLNWGKRIQMDDLLLVDPQSIYFNSVERAIYVRDGKQIKRGKVIHVNGEIKVVDTFNINEGNNELFVGNSYTQKNGNVFKYFDKTLQNITIGSDFKNVYDMQFVDMSDETSTNDWFCKFGEKISREMVCDGHFDCKYGDDESSCEIRYQPIKLYASLPIQDHVV